MENCFKLSVASKAKVSILHITDTHLFANEGETLLGVNSNGSYRAVVEAVFAKRRPFDVIVATGDLAQDRSLTAYQHFSAGVARLSTPCFWLPGNHDFQPIMVDALAAAGIASAKQIVLGDNWQILLLDSQVVGMAYGELSDSQLKWLEDCLAAFPQRYTLVLLHHHPFPSGCAWLDQQGLRNTSALQVILMRFPRAHTLLCGHIHQALDLTFQGKRLLATPSTCVQFKPRCADFTVDTVAPGWRYLDLLPDGRVETEVHRLDNDVFQPDMYAGGYR